VHHREQLVHDPFGLAERQMVDKPEGQGGLNSEIGMPQLPAARANGHGRPGGYRLR
jgi:hypothetical protein